MAVFRSLRSILGQGSTSLVEVLSGFFLALRGGQMLWSLFWGFPLDLQGLLIPPLFTELTWASVLLTLGLAQMLLAGHRHPLARGAAATLAVMSQTVAFVAYFTAHAVYRGAVAFILGLIVANMHLAYRAWTDFLGERSILERRAAVRHG